MRSHQTLSLLLLLLLGKVDVSVWKCADFILVSLWLLCVLVVGVCEHCYSCVITGLFALMLVYCVQHISYCELLIKGNLM